MRRVAIHLLAFSDGWKAITLSGLVPAAIKSITSSYTFGISIGIVIALPLFGRFILILAFPLALDFSLFEGLTQLVSVQFRVGSFVLVRVSRERGTTTGAGGGVAFLRRADSVLAGLLALSTSVGGGFDCAGAGKVLALARESGRRWVWLGFGFGPL